MTPREVRDSAVRWLLGLFAAVLVFLLGIAVQGQAESRHANANQDLEILRLQIADSTRAAAIAEHIRIVAEIRAKVDSILHPPHQP